MSWGSPKDPTIMEEQSNNSELSMKERNCVQRNSLLRQTNQKINASIQSEHNRFERKMDLEAKKLRKKLTLMIQIAKPGTNLNNDAGSCSPSKTENSVDVSGKLKLPVIKSETKSAPCSPTLSHRKATFLWEKATLSPHCGSNPLPIPRRRSYNEIFSSSQGSPVLTRQSSSSLLHRGRPSELIQLSPRSSGLEENNGELSPSLLPRNLKLREQARRDSLLNATSGMQSTQSPSLEEQFKSLGSCRYLRRATVGHVKVTMDDKEKSTELEGRENTAEFS
ncbi:uncharacterized protein LOC111319612 [Stylophora pistillata]|nr:uncharacterized protein LOC111319612 [Stylophora pistillata]